MESIFESLENLNVSEECFDEIVETIFRQIEKVHGEPEYENDWTGTPRPVNKSAELHDKARENRKKEKTLAAYRETNDKTLPVHDYFLGRALKKIEDRRYSDKNEKGERKTEERRPHSGNFNHKSLKKQIEASIDRHYAKQEKKTS